MIQPRILITALLCLGLAILAGCSTTHKAGGGRGGGGYYLDDGPGSNIPPDIDAIPDAVPRMESHSPSNFRPYFVFGKRYEPVSDEKPYRQQGTASWYGRKFHGKKTANGETYDMYAMSAAHPTLPIPSYARVTHAGSGKSVIVRINDRGPFHSSRIIDLSYVAAAKLGLVGPGSGQVIVEAITNEDIRANRYGNPKAAPLEPAPAPETPPLQIVRSARAASPPAAAPATPDALEVLQDGAFDARPQLASAAAAGSAPPGPVPQPRSWQAQASQEQVSREPASPGQIYLQFGAFSVVQTADGLAQKLNRQIAHVESRPAQVDNSSRLYRVRIGPYPSRTAAVNAALRIQEATGLQPAVALR
ncbi:septal ring lytic transglycosylase RlpA family protein [Pollutimonas bauzanensis]|uniref:Endolytic peptidoglycan transglycosylase RlpA n=1 Tax=Pollutimonas bauzanensis TaxID=658167 RepID=A0A1M5RC21_9BURK|nr:septal ring lytic transglycosylase RlpA family protein [Pollutimonas bauzanensis]SHH23882.1 rare lipoprotein A [Pollutimonas bauzanensis]